MKPSPDVQERADAPDFAPGPLSFEQARDLVDQPLEFPQFIKNFWGSENIELLCLLFQDKVIRDVDLSALTGELSLEDTSEYILHSRETLTAFQDLQALAEKMVADIRKAGKIPYRLKGLISPSKTSSNHSTPSPSWGRYYKHSSIAPHTSSPTSQINTRGLHELLSMPSELCGRLVEISEGRIAFLMALTCFYRQLIGALTIAIHEYIRGAFPDRETSIAQQLNAEELQNEYLFPYITIYSSLQTYQNFLAHYPDFLNPLIPSESNGASPDESELSTLFEQVENLARTRTIDFEAMDHKMKFSFFPSVPIENQHFMHQRLINLSAVQVSDPNNAKKYMNFIIDRTSGKLVCPWPIAYIIGQEAEGNLRKIIYTLLLNHLKDKPEDLKPAPIENVGSPSSPDVDGPNDPIEDAQASFMGKTTGLLEPSDPNPSVNIDALRNNTLPASPDQPFDRCRLSIQQILSAINLSQNSNGHLRVLRVDDDKIFSHFRIDWEKLLKLLGFEGNVEWVTMDELGSKLHSDIPLIIPHTLHTHLYLGWKKGQEHVHVIDISSPRLLINWLSQPSNLGMPSHI